MSFAVPLISKRLLPAYRPARKSTTTTTVILMEISLRPATTTAYGLLPPLSPRYTVTDVRSRRQCVAFSSNLVSDKNNE